MRAGLQFRLSGHGPQERAELVLQRLRALPAERLPALGLGLPEVVVLHVLEQRGAALLAAAVHQEEDQAAGLFVEEVQLAHLHPPERVAQLELAQRILAQMLETRVRHVDQPLQGERDALLPRLRGDVERQYGGVLDAAARAAELEQLLLHEARETLDHPEA